MDRSKRLEELALFLCTAVQVKRPEQFGPVLDEGNSGERIWTGSPQSAPHTCPTAHPNSNSPSKTAQNPAQIR
uniref:Uncharacterized protein n=1 Tax=Nelumbo nucifera TaxID=4432 RepID=A0A822ZI85_NELNU|nr:TPA_asm: hypothetical protein HUJ06_002817 [Nelumbo nucifera]